MPGSRLTSSPQDPQALSAEEAQLGPRGPGTAAPILCRLPPRRGRRGRGVGARASRARRRPPARCSLRCSSPPRCPACGPSETARRRTLRSSARAGREAATASSARDRLLRGAGQLGLQGGPRQHHGGRIVAKGGGGGCSALGTRRRRQRRSLLLLLRLPPPPPARVWEGASRMSVLSGREPRPLPSAPPLSLSCRQPPEPVHRLAQTSPPPFRPVQRIDPQAPPTPARWEAGTVEGGAVCVWWGAPR